MDRKTVKKTLLLVEDEAIIALGQKKNLESYGYEVLHVLSGESAVQTAVRENKNIDLILMDINLGKGIDGTEAARQILKQRDIPIVFLSSHTDREIVLKTEKITSYGYVVKSSGIVVLDASIKMAFKLFDSKEETRKTRKYWEKTFDYLQTPAVLLDRDHTILEANRAVIESSGLDEKDIIGKKCFEIFHKEDGPPVDCPMEQLLFSGKHEKQDMRIQAFHGNYLVSCIPILDEKKEIEEIIHTISDISIEEHQNILHDTFKEALDNSTDAVGMSTPEGKHYYQNKAFDELFGEIGDDPPSTLYADEEQGRTVFSTIMSGGAWTGELKMNSRNGEILDIYLRAYANKDKNGNILSLVGIHTDITESKKVNRELAESEKKYRDQSNLLNTVFNSIPDILGINDLNQNVLKYNKAGYDFLKIDGNVIQQKKCYEILGRAEPCEDCAAEKVEISGEPASCEHYLEDRDIWLDVRAYPVKNHDGEIIQIINHLRDITHFRKQREEIEKRLTEKSNLLKEVHHRIKNNINSVSSLLKMQLKNTKSSEAKEALSSACSQLETTYELYAMLSNTEEYEGISIRDYLEKLCKYLRAVIPPSLDIKIITEIDDIILPVSMIFPIGIIVNELITNSMKYAFDGTKSGEIKLKLTEKNKKISLSVTDNGRGLSSDKTVESAQGFGLFLVKAFASQMEGSMEVRSQNGFSTSISFHI